MSHALRLNGAGEEPLRVIFSPHRSITTPGLLHRLHTGMPIWPLPQRSLNRLGAAATWLTLESQMLTGYLLGAHCGDLPLDD